MGINKGKHRQFKPFCHLHQSNHFAVAFWVRHTKIVLNTLTGAATAMLTNQHDRLVVKHRHAPQNRFVIGIRAIPLQHIKFREQLVGIIQK